MNIMQQDHHLLRESLVANFILLYHETPEWAWGFPPSIPFIGEAYRPYEGTLIYASAENLSWMNDEAPPQRFLDERRWDRYRAAYEDSGETSGDFFPDIGIIPANNGGLLVAALFIKELLVGQVAEINPRELLKSMALTNWLKFTIHGPNNKDYIGKASWILPSLPYVITELSILRPALVLIPKAVWERPIYCAAMRGASPNTRFLPVPQFNARVINCKLDRYADWAAGLQRLWVHTETARWMGMVSKLNQNNAWRYLAYLNDLLNLEGCL